MHSLYVNTRKENVIKKTKKNIRNNKPALALPSCIEMLSNITHLIGSPSFTADS